MTTGAPLVSIIIPAYGHSEMTKICIRTVLQTCRERNDVEIVIVDDASPEPLKLLTWSCPGSVDTLVCPGFRGVRTVPRDPEAL